MFSKVAYNCQVGIYKSFLEIETIVKVGDRARHFVDLLTHRDLGSTVQLEAFLDTVKPIHHFMVLPFLYDLDLLHPLGEHRDVVFHLAKFSSNRSAKSRTPANVFANMFV